MRSHFDYDGFGRVVEYKDPLSRRTTTAYDSVWGSPSSFDAFGRVSQVQGPNADERTTIVYDAYHRVTAVTEFADRAGAVPTALFEYRTEQRPASVKSSSLFDQGSNTYISSVSFVDGFGRGVQEQSNAETPGQILVTDRRFNSRGSLEYTTAPTFVAGTLDSGFVALNKTDATSYSQSTYDGLGRVTEAADYTGATKTSAVSTSYDLLTTTRRDSNHNLGGGPSNTVTSTTDVFGNLVRVTDSTGADTTYTYDDLNRLRTVTDVDGNETQIWYDWLSRKTKMIDPSTGEWRYGYDNASNLRHQWSQQSDGTRLHWTEFTYDSLNRLRVEYDRTTGTRLAGAVFTYDTVGGITRYGQLMQSLRNFTPGDTSARTYQRVRGFDGFGRAIETQTVTQLDGVTSNFKTRSTYGTGGQLTSLTYPANNTGGSGDTITYSHNPRTGAPTTASVNGQVIVDGIQYDPYGRVTHMTHGPSGYERAHRFDPTSHRLTNIAAGSDGNLTLDIDYQWDNNGNLTELVDHTNNTQRQCFTYDNGQRLTTASTSGQPGCHPNTPDTGHGPYSHTYTYTATGNIDTYGNTNRTYTYGQNDAGPHAVTRISNAGDAPDWTFTYDPVGNQTSRDLGNGPQTITYNWDQTVHSITNPNPDGTPGDNTTTTTFHYDANDNRIIRDTPTETTWYPTPGHEHTLNKTTGTTTTRTTHTIAGTPIAVDTNTSGQPPERHWTFNDHQTSVSAFIADSDGTANSQRYYPYGHQRLTTTTGTPPGTTLNPTAVNLPTDNGYTGQIRDNTTGLLFYNARYYDPNTARFTQADTIVPNPANPQHHNRYTYVQNSPLIHTDPTGHEECVEVNGTAQCWSEADRLWSNSIAEQDAHSGRDAALAAKEQAGSGGTLCGGLSPGWGAPCDSVRVQDGRIAPVEGWTIFDGIDDGFMEFAYTSFGEPFMIGAIQSVQDCSGHGEYHNCLIGLGLGSLRFLDTASTAASTSRHLCSFSGETEVLMADRTTRPISGVAVGDWVLAEDPETGERGAREVTHLWVHGDTLVDLEIGGEVVTTTEDHPFWNATDVEWQRADVLNAGDHVLTAEGSLLGVNGLIGGSEKWGTAYNLEVADIHTFFVAVGDEQVLVHNNNTCPWINVSDLPLAERNALNTTLSHIDAGTVPTGPTATRWGTSFKNWDGDLPGPSGTSSPYLEYRVAPPPGVSGAGPLRVVVNQQSGATYYTWTHYGDSGDPAFVRIG